MTINSAGDIALLVVAIYVLMRTGHGLDQLVAVLRNFSAAMRNLSELGSQSERKTSGKGRGKSRQR